MMTPTDVLPADLAAGRREQYTDPKILRAYGSGWRMAEAYDTDHGPRFGPDDVDARYHPQGEEIWHAAMDGYEDAAVGRNRNHLVFCRHHENGPGGCGTA